MEFDGNKLCQEIEQGVDAALDKVADRSVERVRQSMPFAAGPSNPGAPPNSHAGDVRASVYRTSLTNHGFIVASNSPIAPYLEHGTRKMAARPFIGPEMPRLEKDAVAAVLKVLGSV